MTASDVHFTNIAVLIETLWNVKRIYRIQFRRDIFRINRNIVECKVASGYTKLESDSVLIETLWNVKVIACAVKYFTLPY